MVRPNVNRKQRIAARKRRESDARIRVSTNTHERAIARARETALGRAPVRPQSHALREVEAALSSGPDLGGPLFARLFRPTRTPELATLLRHAAGVVPRIVCPDYVFGLYWLARLGWLRQLSEHVPRGKGRDSLFRGLAAHLLAAYPTPPFLYNGLFEDDADTLSKVVAAVAGGASLFSQCQSGALSAPLTRRMCHQVMLSPSRTQLMTAIRAAQITGEGGNATLLRAWMGTDAGRRLQTPELERYWHGVLRWFVHNPVAFASVGPLVDYIDHRRGLDPGFCMKRRSARALARAVREWHGELAQLRALDGRVFAVSGFQPGRFDRSVRVRAGGFQHRIWSVDEIRTGAALAEEGRQMRHCVYSYASSIESGRTSIWSMTLFDGAATYRVVTIEVRNVERRIVQARGRLNRPISPAELQILVTWAGENSLELRL